MRDLNSSTFLPCPLTLSHTSCRVSVLGEHGEAECMHEWPDIGISLLLHLMRLWLLYVSF